MPELLDRLKSALADRYAIEREIGAGGMATVYLGVDLRHRRKVAIKVLRPELASNIGLARFEREIEIAASLAHPHILPLHDSGQANGVPFFVMPYVEGETLRDRLFREKQLSVDEALTITREVADGLQYAHRRGCVHRDIKPANILLSEGHAIIADFGIARAIAASGSETLTSAGLVMGTPDYLSPEQAGADENIDGRSDIYSLGCVCFEMLAGKPPFAGQSAQILVMKHLTETPPRLTELRPAVPIEVGEAVARALAKTPADRYATASEFTKALTETDVQVRSPLVRPRWRTRRAVLVSLTLAALGLAFATVRSGLLLPGDAYAVEDARRKFIVLPYQPSGGSAEEDRLARETEDELTRLLTGWKEARAVPRVSKAGLMFDLELSDPLRTPLRQSIALAKEARVGTLVTLTVSIQRDSAYLEVQLHDVATAERLGDPVLSASITSDVFALVAPVATTILGFSGAPEQLISFQRESGNLQAIRQFQEGRASLERWQLESAERLFRATLEQDSTFARAHYLLAVTLYWQAARDELRFSELGGEIRRHASAARRHGAPLVHRDSLFVEAFFAFQEGDLQFARELYDELVRTDSTDTYAWLLLGSVEYQDRWTVEGPDGVLLPRGNLNRARRAFTRTVRLSPDFFLGYGHLFDIYDRLSGSIGSGACYGFLPPSDKVVLIWEIRDPGEQVYLCPVVRDSIEWVDRSTLAATDERQHIAGVDRFLNEARVELGRWSDYAPDDPRPEEELTAWLLARWDLLPRTEAAAARDSLAAEARRHAERALVLKQDTLPEDLILLGALYLSAGDVQRALVLTERGIAAARDASGAGARRLPRMAANVFLATGQVAKALEIELPVAMTRRGTVLDSVENRDHDVLVEGVVARLRVYGATALGGVQLREAFAQMERVWTEAGYNEREKQLIRKALTRRIRPALALDQGETTDWFAGWEPDDPVLAGLLVVGHDSAAAREWLDRSVDKLGAEVPSPISGYVIGVLAQQLGKHDQAIEFFGTLDLWPLGFQGFNVGWGLRSLSHLRRGRSYQALGDTEAALFHYTTFLEYWDDADAELQALVTEARNAIDRLP